MNSAAQQHHCRWLSPRTKVTVRSTWMPIFAFSLTYLLLLTFADAASLHHHSGSHCNHVHPKPNDVSNLSHHAVSPL